MHEELPPEVPYSDGADIERRAHALAVVQKTHDELIQTRAEIADLKTRLHREEDRVVMVVEERNLYRHEALRLRKLLNELTTQMANIALLARKAEDFVNEVDEMDSSPTPAPDVIDKLAKELESKPKPKASSTMNP
jgi:chromosome segregation ATPase